MNERDGMTAEMRSRHETEALIEAIWGPRPAATAAPPDPATRAAQNAALARALEAYLQQYLAEADAAG